MANVLGAIAIFEKRINGKWAQIAENRAEIERLCSKAGKKSDSNAQVLAEDLSKMQMLLEDNRKLMSELEKLYLTRIKV